MTEWMSKQAEPTAPSPKPGGGRIAGLDAARAIAVIAMVFGHTMDATLSDEARKVPWVETYWHLRSFTAPLFLFVSGWVLLTVLSRTKLQGAAIFRKFLPRVTLIFALGYLVRFPIWNLRGLFRLDSELWSYFSTFDALQCIAFSLLTALAICALLPAKAARIGTFVALAVVSVAASPFVWSALGASGKPYSIAAQTFGGGDSRFAVFPWTGYFFIGAALSMFLMPLTNRWVRSGLMLGLAALLFTVLPGERANMNDTDALRFLWRLGPVLTLVSVMLVMPTRVASVLAPVGKVSLWAYVIHLPIAYGWGYWGGLSTRVGHTLSDTQACLVALGVVAVSVTLALLAPRLSSLRKWQVSWSAARTEIPRRNSLTDVPVPVETSLPVAK